MLHRKSSFLRWQTRYLDALRAPWRLGTEWGFPGYSALMEIWCASGGSSQDDELPDMHKRTNLPRLIMRCKAGIKIWGCRDPRTRTSHPMATYVRLDIALSRRTVPCRLAGIPLTLVGEKMGAEECDITNCAPTYRKAEHSRTLSAQLDERLDINYGITLELPLCSQLSQ